MVWQDVFPNVGPKLDAEHERELRLVEQARAGADWALAALIARYQPPVTRYLTRLTGSPVKARILAEHVFIRMERRLHGSQGGRQLRLWLLRACTEAGLEMLRGPREAKNLRLVESGGPAGLLTSGSSPAVNFLRAGLGKLATMTGSTSRQVRKLIWSNAPVGEAWSPRAHGHFAHIPGDQPANVTSDGEPESEEDGFDTLDPREALRHRMVRAVLAELPYGDAQCLALHLVAGLNQAEVALALGITASATRRRIVHGLTLFAQRYDAAAASLGLPLEFFETPTEASAEDGSRFDSADRPMPMVVTIADDVEADRLTTNEHIAVQPFGHDEGALIWNGRIHNEMKTEVNDATANETNEVAPLIVEASLAHVGEPVEIPEPVAALPPPPDIPLTVTDMRIRTEAHVANVSIVLSSPLTLEDITLPAGMREGETQWPEEDAVRPGQIVSDAEDGTNFLDLNAGNTNEGTANVTDEVRVVPILTEWAALDALPEDAISARHRAEYSNDRPDSRDNEPTSTRGAPDEMDGDEIGRRGVRVVPVLTTAPSPRGVALENADETRVVPVLTSSFSGDGMTPTHMLHRREQSTVGSDTAAGIDAADGVDPPEHPPVALAGRGGIVGETDSETL